MNLRRTQLCILIFRSNIGHNRFIRHVKMPNFGGVEQWFYENIKSFDAKRVNHRRCPVTAEEIPRVFRRNRAHVRNSLRGPRGENAWVGRISDHTLS